MIQQRYADEVTFKAATKQGSAVATPRRLSVTDAVGQRERKRRRRRAGNVAVRDPARTNSGNAQQRGDRKLTGSRPPRPVVRGRKALHHPHGRKGVGGEIRGCNCGGGGCRHALWGSRVGGVLAAACRVAAPRAALAAAPAQLIAAILRRLPHT